MVPRGHLATAPCALVSARQDDDQGIGRVVPPRSDAVQGTGQFKDTVKGTKTFGVDAVIDGACNGRGLRYLVMGTSSLMTHINIQS